MEKREPSEGQEEKALAETTEEKAEEEIQEKEEAETEVLEKEEAEAKIETTEEAPVPTVEEAKPPEREEKPEEEIVEERIYTIPLSKAWIQPPRKRAPRAMRILKSFLIKHMKLEKRAEGMEEEEEPKRLIITNEVNEKIWGRGIEKPPRKIRVRAAKDKEGNVTVYLAEGD
ncbi:MAG: 50S ribosomal protein L31e [Candidatus Bathyarchaeia archaeon]